jgi:hypothetical protein
MIGPPRRIRRNQRNFGATTKRAPASAVCAANLRLATDSQFVDGTFLHVMRITMQKLIENVNKALATQPPHLQMARDSVADGGSRLKESNMDAKYNWLIDNGAVRLTLNTVALVLWVAMAVGLLELASRV